MLLYSQTYNNMNDTGDKMLQGALEELFWWWHMNTKAEC